MSKERYKQNRRRVCEIYGVDPKECSCHHIIQRSDAKDRHSEFYGYDVDQLSNLYPFKADRPSHTSSEHIRTHQLIQATESHTIYRKKKKRRK